MWSIKQQIARKKNKDTGEYEEFPVNVKDISWRPTSAAEQAADIAAGKSPRELKPLGLTVKQILVEHSSGSILTVKHSTRKKKETDELETVKLSIVYPDKEEYETQYVGEGRNRRPIPNKQRPKKVVKGAVEDFILPHRFVETSIKKFGYDVALQVFGLLDGQDYGKGEKLPEVSGKNPFTS